MKAYQQKRKATNQASNLTQAWNHKIASQSWKLLLSAKSRIKIITKARARKLPVPQVSGQGIFQRYGTGRGQGNLETVCDKNYWQKQGQGGQPNAVQNHQLNQPPGHPRYHSGNVTERKHNRHHHGVLEQGRHLLLPQKEISKV
jgi:hypothetical protein